MAKKINGKNGKKNLENNPVIEQDLKNNPNLVIHNIFFEWVIDNVLHKIEVRDQFNKKISVNYVSSLLNWQIDKFKNI